MVNAGQLTHLALRTLTTESYPKPYARPQPAPVWKRHGGTIRFLVCCECRVARQEAPLELLTRSLRPLQRLLLPLSHRLLPEAYAVALDYTTSVCNLPIQDDLKGTTRHYRQVPLRGRRRPLRWLLEVDERRVRRTIEQLRRNRARATA